MTGAVPPPARVVRALLDRHGRTYADEAGITLSDSPGPVFRLLTLALLLSARIRADAAVSAARALAGAGWTTPQALAGATWEQRVRVLNKAGYARYDEKTATMLDHTAALLLDRYGGDLRRLRHEARHDPVVERRLLQQFPGIGPVGSSIFAREVQGVWPELYPYVDQRALAVAARLGLGSDATDVQALGGGPDALTVLVAALVRCGLARDEDGVLAAARDQPAG
jgi:hypothetical protein